MHNINTLFSSSSRLHSIALGEIVDIVHFQSSNIYKTVAAFGTTVMSTAIEQNATWPYVQIPHFEQRGQDNDAISKALMIAISPLVTRENKEAYLNYTYNNQGWIQEGLNVQCYVEDTECVTQEWNISTYMARLSDGASGATVPQNEAGADFGPGQYAPMWQYAPVASDPYIVGLDTLSHPSIRRVYYGMWETQKPVMSEVVDLEFFYRGAVEEKSDRPKSFLLHPLYPYFEDKNTTFQRDDIVGFVMAILPWDVYFANILPTGVNNIHLILHDTCDNDHTFELHGADAVYIGTGDLHEPKYDHLRVETEFAPFLDYNFSDTHAHCEYTIRIYPSQAFEDEFHTMSPVWYTLLILVVFGFTAMTFLLYDYVVQVWIELSFVFASQLQTAN
jgi:CHASE domain